MEVRKLNWREFFNEFQPIENLFELNSAVDGYLFINLEHLKNVPNIRLWSLIHDTQNDDMYITNGMRMINKIGHLVSKVEHDPNKSIEVRLTEGDYIKEDNGSN